jgi:hypothetical protein
VGKIHKTINEKQYGRNPHEPLAPGEATGSRLSLQLPEEVVMIGLTDGYSGSKLERSTSEVYKALHRRVEESISGETDRVAERTTKKVNNHGYFLLFFFYDDMIPNYTLLSACDGEGLLDLSRVDNGKRRVKDGRITANGQSGIA